MNLCNRVFHLDEHGTTIRRELIGALTSFFAIAYIIFVTPDYLSKTGMDYTAVLIASCVAAAAGCFLSAIFGFPFILTPGVGLNAFFTYTLCLTMGYTWQQGLAVVFISGLLYLLISITPLRGMMISCIPPSMKNAISAGLGLFISLIGLFNSGLVVAENGGMMLGPVTAPNVFLAVIGMLITGVLMSWKVKGAMLIGIIATTLIGIPMGVTQIPEHITLSGISMTPVLLQIDFGGILSLGILPLISAVVTFTMCLCFDTLGDIICIAGAGNMLEEDGSIGKNSRVMVLNAVGTCCSCILGGPALIPPVEGSTGIAEGARTGLHSMAVGILFLLSILIAPIAGLIPSAATAPSLILIGMLMIGNAANIYWHNLEIALPCFLTMIMIPFTYSVADGIGVGFISYVGIHLITGRWKKVPPITYILAGMFVIMYLLSAL